MSQLAELEYQDFLPRITSSSIQSGNASAFTRFAPQVKQILSELGITQEELWQELGKRLLVMGQESTIGEIAQDLMNL
jgi:hypothetical protein